MIASVKGATAVTIKSAVAAALTETVLQNMYEKFSKCSEMSVVKTVMDDLRKENEEETKWKLEQEQKN